IIDGYRRLSSYPIRILAGISLQVRLVMRICAQRRYRHYCNMFPPCPEDIVRRRSNCLTGTGSRGLKLQTFRWFALIHVSSLAGLGRLRSATVEPHTATDSGMGGVGGLTADIIRAAHVPTRPTVLLPRSRRFQHQNDDEFRKSPRNNGEQLCAMPSNGRKFLEENTRLGPGGIRDRESRPDFSENINFDYQPTISISAYTNLD
ncbi:unnamed protein product, partial [Nesidiocoris tenuis]